ncbi:hypothetical protein NDU88_006449 [Pleurodeles waltl]|uniref:Myb/SANT-like DNA-binding domain-containing protein n=1 Tax=Pleurodeles waltl TaxID=8319 RepID=A0AAV7X0Q0_PLEWA|nr:hypothetical protein NDU88_006449 [Pleurodeles waltl]
MRGQFATRTRSRTADSESAVCEVAFCDREKNGHAICEWVSQIATVLKIECRCCRTLWKTLQNALENTSWHMMMTSQPGSLQIHLGGGRTTPISTSAQQTNRAPATMAENPSKRKLKFAEKELEVLPDECCQHHDQLFGRAALTVPETEKRELWQKIQDKVNSLGVSHRSVEELKKRWYDLRSRTKERVAEWLREMRGTGGGPSTVSPPTPLEERVEETLEPEAVSGMGDLDTSEPGPSTGEYHVTCMYPHQCHTPTHLVHRSMHNQDSSISE